MGKMENFRYIIAEERKRAGLTQEALAVKLGITPQAVSKWENGVGYPDVTLFPTIAEVLNVPIQRLFGETEEPQKEEPQKAVIECPARYGDLPLVCSQNGRGCYSSKAVARVDRETCRVFFEDGSEADLSSGQAVNRGEGEIRIYEIKEMGSEFSLSKGNDATRFSRTYSHFEELEISNARFCRIQVKIEKSMMGKSCVVAVGTPEFISALHCTFSGKKLTIGIKNRNDSTNHRENNQLTVYTDADVGMRLKVSVIGAGECAIEPSFDDSVIHITGEGSVTAANAGEAMLRITGSGDIKMGHVSDKADICITGSGDATLKSASNAKCSITGSGDVDIKEVRGNLAVKICGSGDVSCAGEVEELGIHITGSGDFNGGNLTADNAKITVGNNSSITIGRIKGDSVEKIGINCHLRVEKRG